MNVLGLGLGLTHNAGAASEAIFNAFPNDPSASDRFLIGRAVRSLQASGLWYRLDCLHVYAAATSGNGLVNWISPGTFDATLNAGGASNPTFAAYRGFTTDGAANFIDTNFNPTVGSPKFTQNDNSGGAWLLDNVQANNAAFGWSATNGWFVSPRTTSNLFSFRTSQASSDTVANSDSSGLSAVERTASNADRALRNGVSLKTNTTASAALTNNSLRCGNAGAASFSAHQFAMDFLGQSLPGTANHLALYNIMLAYMQGVGAA